MLRIAADVEGKISDGGMFRRRRRSLTDNFGSRRRSRRRNKSQYAVIKT
jgi:hypothetical protein